MLLPGDRAISAIGAPGIQTEHRFLDLISPPGGSLGSRATEFVQNTGCRAKCRTDWRRAISQFSLPLRPAALHRTYALDVERNGTCLWSIPQSHRHNRNVHVSGPL